MPLSAGAIRALTGARLTRDIIEPGYLKVENPNLATDPIGAQSSEVYLLTSADPTTGGRLRLS